MEPSLALQKSSDELYRLLIRSSKCCSKDWSSLASLPSVLHDIFSWLDPIDFEAARRSDQTWFESSLSRPSLLVEMLKRGGWWGAVFEESRQHPGFSLMNSKFLSRRLSRECSFSPRWRGHGVISRPAAPLTKTSIEDLTHLFDNGPPHVMTFSLCGRFLLMAEGLMIRVFELAGSANPVAEIDCPRKVIALSMDTSAGHYGVAALLKDGWGVIYDLQSYTTLASHPGQPAEPLVTYPMTVFTDLLSHDSPPLSIAISPNHAKCIAVAGKKGAELHWIDGQHGTYRMRQFYLWSRGDCLHFRPNRPRNGAALAASTDPPEVVRLIASETAIAIGGGTGHSLAALHAFAHAYAHAQAHAQAHTHAQTQACAQAYAQAYAHTYAQAYAHAPNRRRLARVPAQPFSYLGAVPLSDGVHLLFTSPADRALYIGVEMTFPNGSIALLKKMLLTPPPPQSRNGNMNAIGAVGQAQAREQARAQANFSVSMSASCSPYAVGRDLSYGARVIAAFGRDIVLFCVPPDMLRDMQARNRLEDMDAEGNAVGRWADWLEGDATVAQPPRTDDLDAGPGAFTGVATANLRLVPTSNDVIRIHGFRIGSVDGAVVDIAVQSAPMGDLVVWAVEADGRAMMWRIGNEGDE